MKVSQRRPGVVYQLSKLWLYPSAISIVKSFLTKLDLDPAQNPYNVTQFSKPQTPEGVAH